jgi:hypothetical protein
MNINVIDITSSVNIQGSYDGELLCILIRYIDDVDGKFKIAQKLVTLTHSDCSLDNKKYYHE